jgi:hypothetical protein
MYCAVTLSRSRADSLYVTADAPGSLCVTPLAPFVLRPWLPLCYAPDSLYVTADALNVTADAPDYFNVTADAPDSFCFTADTSGFIFQLTTPFMLRLTPLTLFVFQLTPLTPFML